MLAPIVGTVELAAHQLVRPAALGIRRPRAPTETAGPARVHELGLLSPHHEPVHGFRAMLPDRQPGVQLSEAAEQFRCVRISSTLPYRLDLVAVGEAVPEEAGDAAIDEIVTLHDHVAARQLTDGRWVQHVSLGAFAVHDQ